MKRERIKHGSPKDNQLVDLTCELIKFPSEEENESEIQDYIAGILKKLDLKVDKWELKKEELKKHEWFVPVEKDYRGRPNVVGVLKGGGIYYPKWSCRLSERMREAAGAIGGGLAVLQEVFRDSTVLWKEVIAGESSGVLCQQERWESRKDGKAGTKKEGGKHAEVVACVGVGGVGNSRCLGC